MPPGSLLFQTALANSLITDEYLRNARTPEEVRDRFTDLIGDILMTLPVLSVAGRLSGAETRELEQDGPEQPLGPGSGPGSTEPRQVPVGNPRDLCPWALCRRRRSSLPL